MLIKQTDGSSNRFLFYRVSCQNFFKLIDFKYLLVIGRHLFRNMLNPEFSQINGPIGMILIGKKTRTYSDWFKNIGKF